MKGFFSKQQTESKSRPDGKKLSCTACGLYQFGDSPRMQPFGNFKKGILNIGEAPSEVDDKRGKQWQGKTGNFLYRTFQRHEIDLFQDCLNINAINCLPMDRKNEIRVPNHFEIDCCRKTIVQQVIDEYQPKVINVFGTSALYSVIGKRWKKDLGSISKWRGFVIPDQELKTYICPMFHPSFVEKETNYNPVVAKIWEDDIVQSILYSNKEFKRYKQPRIEIIEDLSIFDSIKTGAVVPDIETTGLKPHAEGHRIICIGVAVNPDLSYVFMVPGKTRRQLRPFINLMTNPDVKKLGQNIKYEDTWFKVRMGIEVNGWEWDAMLASHILDNRPEITNLKFQTYVNFGIIDYASKITPFLKSIDEDNANSLNRILELVGSESGRNELMTYCGYDTIYEYRLAMLQQEIINFDGLPF